MSIFFRIYYLKLYCFDPILDPTPDRNPFRIEIQITIGIVFFLLDVRLLKLCKISNIFFNGENDV